MPHGTTDTGTVPARVCGFEISETFYDGEKTHLHGGRVIITGAFRDDMTATVDGVTRTVSVNASGSLHIDPTTGQIVLTGQSLIGTLDDAGHDVYLYTQGRVVVDADGLIVSQNGRVTDVCSMFR